MTRDLPEWFRRRIIDVCGAPYPHTAEHAVAQGASACIDRLAAVHPKFLPLFQAGECRTHDGNVRITNIPTRAGTSTYPGWHVALAAEFAGVFRCHHEATAVPPEFRPVDSTVTFSP